MDPVVVDGAHVARVLLGHAEPALDVTRAAGGGGVDAELVDASARRDGGVISNLVAGKGIRIKIEIIKFRLFRFS